MQALFIVLGASMGPPLVVYMFLSSSQAKIIWFVVSFIYMYALFRYVFKEANSIVWAACLCILMTAALGWYKDFERSRTPSSTGYEECEVNRFGVQVCN